MRFCSLTLLAAILSSYSNTNAFTFTRPTNPVQDAKLGSKLATQLSVTSDAAARAAAAMEAEDAGKNAVGGASMGVKLETLLESGGRPFPLSMVVGQDAIKQALLLSAVNNRMVRHHLFMA